jgi:2'-5' RNA ligase
MRAFVALEISEEAVLDEIERSISELLETGADLKRVSRPNLHFTLRFLGEISDEQAREVERRLTSLDLQKAEVTVMRMGAFPDVRRPRVVWVGVSKDDEEKVMGIAGPILGSLKGIGQEDARPFQPHLTVARVRSNHNSGPLASFLEANSSRLFGRASLAHLKLKSSELRPSGPVYTDVGAYVLK